MHEHGLGGVGRGSRHLRVVARMHTECAGHEHKVRSRGSLLWLGHDRSIKPRPRLRRRQRASRRRSLAVSPWIRSEREGSWAMAMVHEPLGAHGRGQERPTRCEWRLPRGGSRSRRGWFEVLPSLSQAPRKPLASPLPSPSKQARAYLAPPSAIFTLGLTIGDRIDVGRAASCPTKIRSGPSRTKRNGGPTSMRSNMLEPSVRAS